MNLSQLKQLRHVTQTTLDLLSDHWTQTAAITPRSLHLLPWLTTTPAPSKRILNFNQWKRFLRSYTIGLSNRRSQFSGSVRRRRMFQKSVHFDDKVSCIYYVIPEGNRLRPLPRKRTRQPSKSDTFSSEKTSPRRPSIEAQLLPWVPESNWPTRAFRRASRLVTFSRSERTISVRQRV